MYVSHADIYITDRSCTLSDTLGGEQQSALLHEVRPITSGEGKGVAFQCN